MVKLFTFYKKSTFSIVFSFMFFPLFCQLWPSNEDIYKEAEDYLLEEEYNEALPLYLMLQEKGYNTANIKFKIGECYIHTPGQKLKALSYLEESSKEASKKYKGTKLEEDRAPVSSVFLLAVAYRLNNKFDKAIETFKIVKDFMHPEDVENRRIIDMHMNRCINAIELTNAPINIKKTKLDNIINSAFSNYNPLLTADESVIVYMDKLKFYDAIMQSTMNNGYWTNPVNLTPKTKSDGEFNVVGISSDGKKLLFNSFNPLTNGDIYQSAFENRKWSRITKLNENINSKFNETHASLSNDGNVLYFTSSRRGGYGGLDIYKSELDENGDWGSAVNLGPIINSPYNEESPFITTDGKRIYFSSQGHYNMGGYDLFYSELSESGTWMHPANIGFPINTSDDDLFFYPVGDGTTGYHSKFTGSDNNDQDIFKYEIITIADPVKFNISGKVDIPDSVEYELNSVSVTFVDLQKNDTLITKYCNSEGEYDYKIPSGEYELTFSTEGRQFYSRKITIPLNFPEEELIVNTNLEMQLIVEEEVLLIAEKDTFFIDDIFYGFDSYSLNEDAITFLDKLTKLLTEYPKIIIRIYGFTDSIGSSEYNQFLSERRAGSVGSYLEGKGITNDRITIKGFGETKHIAINSSSEGRKINRRVETEIVDSDNNFILIRIFIVPDNLAVE